MDVTLHTGVLVLLLLLRRPAASKRVCQRVEVEACKDLPYNLTTMPNLVGHDDQAEAEMQLSTFAPLVQIQCSSQLKFLLCSLYVPMCTDKVELAIGPCRPLCESVRSCCEPTLKQFGFPWPELLDCAGLPAENNAQAMCMKGPGPGAGLAEPQHCTAQYPPPPPVAAATLASAPAGQRDRATTALLLALAVCSSAVSTLVLGVRCTRRHALRQRAIGAAVFYVTCCSGLASGALLLRVLWGRQDAACVVDATGQHVLVTRGVNNVLCTTVAVVFFYFTTAARLWWLSACAAWLTTSSNRWPHRNFHTHLVCWLSPVVATAVMLADQAVDANPWTAVCSVGNVDVPARHKFLLVPEALAAALGLALLVRGFTLGAVSSPGAKTSRGHWRQEATVCWARLPVSCLLLVCYLNNSANNNLGWALLQLLADFSYGLVAGVWLAVTCVSSAAPLANNDVVTHCVGQEKLVNEQEATMYNNYFQTFI